MKTATGNCPACDNYKSKVVNSRFTTNKFRLRRRECKLCRHRWTTYEIGEEAYKKIHHNEKLLRRIKL